MSDTPAIIPPTEDQLIARYSALLDSVNYINAIISGTTLSISPRSDIERNIEHIRLTIAANDFGARDMSAINDVLMIDADTVEIQTFTDYSDQLAARRARTIGPRDFMDRFTTAEKLGIMALSQQSAEIQLWLSEALADEVWLDHPKVDAGLQAVIDSGANVLTEARKIEIIGA